jgi:hypothetical protein
MPSPFLSGLSSNPNAGRPSYGMTPNPNQGWGSIREILAGMNTLQTNTPGMPTNTAPMSPQAPQYGMGQPMFRRQSATPTQFGGIQDMIDRGYTWSQIYSLAQQGNHGVSLNDYYSARTANGNGQISNPNGGIYAGYGNPSPQGTYTRPVVQPTYGFQPKGGGPAVGYSSPPAAAPGTPVAPTPAPPTNVNTTVRPPRTGFAGGY